MLLLSESIVSVKPKSPGIAPAIQHDHKAGNFDGRCSWVGSVDNFFIMLISGLLSVGIITFKVVKNDRKQAFLFLLSFSRSK